MERRIFTGERIGEQLLEELSQAQKMLEKRTETQGQMIKRLQTLMENEGLFSKIIDFMPYPFAIFSPRYTLTITNKAFEVVTRVSYPQEGDKRIFKHRIRDMQLAESVTGVFAGGDILFGEPRGSAVHVFGNCAAKTDGVCPT